MQEKSEKASSHKLKKAREQGYVPHSSELAFAIIFLGALAFLWLFSHALGKGFLSLFLVYIQLDSANLAIFPLVKSVLFILGGLFLLAILAHFIQTGWRWKWRGEKKRGKSRILLTFLKMAGIFLIGYAAIQGKKPGFECILASAFAKSIFLFHTLFFLLLKIGLFLLLLGLGDYFYQRWKYEKQMRMTRQEIKEEKREEEGDRETKSQMRKRS